MKILYSLLAKYIYGIQVVREIAKSSSEDRGK